MKNNLSIFKERWPQFGVWNFPPDDVACGKVSYSLEDWLQEILRMAHQHEIDWPNDPNVRLSANTARNFLVTLAIHLSQVSNTDKDPYDEFVTTTGGEPMLNRDDYMLWVETHASFTKMLRAIQMRMFNLATAKGMSQDEAWQVTNCELNKFIGAAVNKAKAVDGLN